MNVKLNLSLFVAQFTGLKFSSLSLSSWLINSNGNLAQNQMSETHEGSRVSDLTKGSYSSERGKSNNEDVITVAATGGFYRLPRLQ